MTLEEILSGITSLFKTPQEYMAFHKAVNDTVTGLIKVKTDAKDVEIEKLKGTLKEISVKPIDEKFYSQFKNNLTGDKAIDNTEIVKRLVSTEKLSDDPTTRETQLEAFGKKFETYLKTLKVETEIKKEGTTDKMSGLGINEILLTKALEKQGNQTKTDNPTPKNQEQLLTEVMTKVKVD